MPDDPKPCVIFDLDGTLADVRHRLPLIKRSPPDWPAFFDACKDDPPHRHVVELMRMIHWYSRGFCSGELLPALFVCSGRPDSHRAVTEEWMRDYVGGGPAEYATVLMRATGDHRADHVVKKEMLNAIRGQGYEPIFAVDDRPSVVRMWRANGVPVLACDDTDWVDAGHGANEFPHAGKTLLTLMVGPSGAGKTTWAHGFEPVIRAADDPVYAKEEYRIDPSHVLSSNRFREDICGDWRDQTRNAEVFAALHAVASARLGHGVPTTIDATHLRRRDRMAAAALAPPRSRVRYVVLDRPLVEKLTDARTPEEVVRKHDHVFRSQLKDILAGDGLPNVDVVDLRTSK